MSCCPTGRLALRLRTPQKKQPGRPTPLAGQWARQHPTRRGFAPKPLGRFHLDRRGGKRQAAAEKLFSAGTRGKPTPRISQKTSSANPCGLTLAPATVHNKRVPHRQRQNNAGPSNSPTTTTKPHHRPNPAATPQKPRPPDKSPRHSTPCTNSAPAQTRRHPPQPSPHHHHQPRPPRQHHHPFGAYLSSDTKCQ